MTILFYISSAIAIIGAMLAITGTNVMRSLLNLVVSFLAISAVLWTLGAPFAAALQIVVYAGAILVLFVFVVMILNLGHISVEKERGLLRGVKWLLPMVMTAVLLVQFILVTAAPGPTQNASIVSPKLVGVNLYTTYLIGVELASILLLAALVAAYHYGAFMIAREDSDE